MNVRKFLSTVGLTALSLFLAPSFANAATITRLPDFTDTEFRDLLSGGGFKELFVAEGRIGNNRLSGDRELGINNAAFQPVVEGQFIWNSGQTEDFQLEYDGSLVNYTVGGKLLSSAFSGPVDTIYVRTRETPTSNVRLDNLFLNGIALGASAFSEPGNSDPDRIDYLLIEDISAPFSLTGKVALSWTETVPRLSTLAYQIKVGPSVPEVVPEPGTMGALLLTGIAAISCRQRKRLANQIEDSE